MVGRFAVGVVLFCASVLPGIARAQGASAELKFDISTDRWQVHWNQGKKAKTLECELRFAGETARFACTKEKAASGPPSTGGHKVCSGKVHRGAACPGSAIAAPRVLHSNVPDDTDLRRINLQGLWAFIPTTVPLPACAAEDSVKKVKQAGSSCSRVELPLVRRDDRSVPAAPTTAQRQAIAAELRNRHWSEIEDASVHQPFSGVSILALSTARHHPPPDVRVWQQRFQDVCREQLGQDAFCEASVVVVRP